MADILRTAGARAGVSASSGRPPRRLRLHNSVFKLKPLHSSEFSQRYHARNNRGLFDGNAITAAHLPSYMYWLFFRGGIALSETMELHKAGRLLYRGKPIAPDSDFLKTQIPWHELANEDFKVVNARGEAVDPVQRALHRTYHMLDLRRTLNFVSDPAEPRSIVHSITDADPAAFTSFNVLTPAGFLSTMRGVVVVTNDIMLPPLWHNEFLGCRATYDCRFHAGCPDDVVDGLVRTIQRKLADVHVYPDIGGPATVVKDYHPSCTASSSGSSDMKSSKSKRRNRTDFSNDAVALDSPTPCRGDVRLLIDTPMINFNLWSSIRRNLVAFRMIKNGPFEVPASEAPVSGSRPLTAKELETLYVFERKLKTNKIVMGLRSLQGHGEETAGMTPEGNEQYKAEIERSAEAALAGDSFVYGSRDPKLGNKDIFV